MSEAKGVEENRTVHLVSQEGELFDVPLHVAKMSELVKTMIDEDQDDEEAQEIPLPNVKSSILAKVIEFSQHYKVEPMHEIEKVYFPSFSLFALRKLGIISLFVLVFSL
jgi:S-phase kinase-associated protein 1